MNYPIEFKYRFEVLIPLADNDGQRLPWSKIDRVARSLMTRFGGCRCQPLAPYLGIWRHLGIIYREGLLMFTVDAPRSDESLDWIFKYKQRLKQQFRQVEIYLAVTELLWL